MSKCLLTRVSISSSEILFVPKVLTISETGFATPIAYATCTSHLSDNPAATIFFATYLHM